MSLSERVRVYRALACPDGKICHRELGNGKNKTKGRLAKAWCKTAILHFGGLKAGNFVEKRKVAR
jgi:hypothetical protein